MADSATIKYRVQYAANGDYTDLPLLIDHGVGRDFISGSVTRQKQIRESFPTSTTTITLADFATVVQALFVNEDLTNYVTVTWTSAATANSQRVPPGQPLLIPQADIANITIAANTAACVGTLIVLGT